MPSKFSLRRFVTFVEVLSFAVAGVSGALLFLRPEGSIARWVGWSALGLDKRQWEAVHITFTATFLAASLAHLWFNWRALVSYLRRKKLEGTGSPAWRVTPPLELVGALMLVVLVGLGTLGQQPPFSALLDLRGDVKDGKLVLVTPPPVAEADRLTVLDVARATALSEQRLLSNARHHGIVIRDASATIAAIARAHRRSPQDVYRAMVGPRDGQEARP